MARPPKPADRAPVIRRKKKKSNNPIDELQKVANSPVEVRHIHRLFKEMFRSKNDRGAAILLGTYVEDALQKAIENALHIRPKQHRALFGINSPLGTFANKIRFAFALDIIGPETFHNLDIIREIRNAFAHSRIHLSFKTKQVREACGLLTIPTDISPYPWLPRTETARQIFESTCFISAKNLEDWAGSALRRPVVQYDGQRWMFFDKELNKSFPIPPSSDLVLRRKSLP
jgi:hypothetical protein